MKIVHLLIALLITAILATLVIPWITKAIEEPFQSCPSTEAKIEFADETGASMPDDWNSTVKYGQSFFNRLADVIPEAGRSIWTGTYTKTQDDGKSVVDYDNINVGIRQALENVELTPIADPRYGPSAAVYSPKVIQTRGKATAVGGNEQTDPAFRVEGRLDLSKPMTGFGQSMSYVEERYPPLSGKLEKVTKCQAITIDGSGTNTRLAACQKLAESTNGECGVCIKDGTAYNDPGSNGKYMGGLYISARDMQKAEARAMAEGKPVSYQPSVGKCPEGYFFIDSVNCEAAVRRLNCEEYGEAGGFAASGKISDGTAASTLAGTCRSCPKHNTYVYKASPTSAPNIFVRVAVPSGTGRNRIIVLKVGSSTTQEKDITFQADVVDETVTGSKSANEVRFQLTGVTPDQKLQFIVVQEFPHRPRGEKEVFFVKPGAGDVRFSTGFSNYATAETYAKSIGCTLATLQQLTNYNQSGGQVCEAGWIEDDEENVYTSHLTADLKSSVCSVNSDKAGVISTSTTTGAGCWCYGIKPSQSHISPTTLDTSMSNYQNITNKVSKFDPVVLNFYNYIERTIAVDESLKQSKYSIYGDTNAAPNYRGAIVQIEMGTSDAGAYMRRREPVERFVTNVNNEDIINLGDGKRKPDYLTKYRRLGLFSQSLMVTEPKPQTLPAMIENQYWLWGTDVQKNIFYFTMEFPGYLNDPDYPEDTIRCPTGALLTSKKYLDRYEISPCEGGLDKVECLQHLFKRVGGTSKGLLYPANDTGVNYMKIRYADYILPSGNVNSSTPTDKRTETDMEAYLQQYMNVIQKGIYPQGIQNAKKRDLLVEANKLMFGEEGLTPCQTVVEYGDGTNQIVKKQELDEVCLDHLYRNTETYKSIGTRYSGIKEDELASQETLKAYPYQTCQPKGSWAPIGPDGTPNTIALAQIREAMKTVGGLSSPNNTNVDKAMKVFDTIYQAANNSSAPEAEQAAALERCYGVVKKQYLTNCKGIQTNAIRILASAYFLDTQEERAHIMTIGIAVNDINGSAIAYTVGDVIKSKYNTSSALSDYADRTVSNAGTYDKSQSFVAIPLGSTKNLSSVLYKVTPNNGKLAQGIVVQLLSGDDVVAQHVLTDKIVANGEEQVYFTAEDMRPLIPTTSLSVDMRFRLESAIYPGLFLVFTSGVVGLKTAEARTDYDNSILALKDDVNGFRGKASVFSLLAGSSYMSVDRTNQIVGGAQDIWSSWAIQPAMNRAPAFVNIESATFPGYFVIPDRVPGSNDRIAKIVSLDFTQPYNQFIASWKLVPVD